MQSLLMGWHLTLIRSYIFEMGDKFCPSRRRNNTKAVARNFGYDNLIWNDDASVLSDKNETE